MSDRTAARTAGAQHVAQYVARVPTKHRLDVLRNVAVNVERTLKSGELTEIETLQYEGALDWTREQIRLALS